MSRAREDVLAKLRRAHTHINEFQRIAETIRDSKCSILSEKDFDKRWTVRRVHITPAVPGELALIAGEVLNHLRSALDYMVTGAAETATAGSSSRSNQFPIEVSLKRYKEAVGRNRLIGVPDEACAIIESLQPYHPGNDALLTLNDLNNADKHRALHVLAGVSTWSTLSSNMGSPITIESDIYLRDGGVFGPPIPFDLEERFPAMRAGLADYKLEGECTVEIELVHGPEPEFPEEDEFERALPLLRRLHHFVTSKVWVALEQFVA